MLSACTDQVKLPASALKCKRSTCTLVRIIPKIFSKISIINNVYYNQFNTYAAPLNFVTCINFVRS